MYLSSWFFMEFILIGIGNENTSKFADFPFTIFPPSDECRGKCCGNGFISEPHFVYHLPYPGEESTELVLGKDETTLYRVTVSVAGDGAHESVNVPDTIDVETGEVIGGKIKGRWHVTHENFDSLETPCDCVYCSPGDGQPRRKKPTMRMSQGQSKKRKRKRKKSRQEGNGREKEVQRDKCDGSRQNQIQPLMNWRSDYARYNFQFNCPNYQQHWGNYAAWEGCNPYYDNQWANYYYGPPGPSPMHWNKCCQCWDCRRSTDYYWRNPQM